MHYDPVKLDPPCCPVVAVITHDHLDHFDPSLFLPRSEWKVMGPASVTRSIPPDRVVAGDSVSIGNFSVIAVPSPHTADHRSLRVRWADRVLFFAGDTEDASAVASQPPLDLLFTSPWLGCTLEAAGWPARIDRTIVYHLAPDGSDRICGPGETLPQGAVFTISRAPDHGGD